MTDNTPSTDELDDKLEEILDDWYPGTQYGNVIPLLKQAFADAGYIQVPKEVQETWREYNRMAGYMTGKEWYERFISEMGEDATYCTGCSCDAVEAARKASGIDN